MAEKVVQTRIINKHADLATWKDSSLVLKTGEIALARVDTQKPDGHGGYYTVPTYLMKVGDSEKTFSQLEWLAAPASDVYEWAKAATKPGYTATEITRGSSNVATDLKAAEDAITALQTAIGGSGSVATMIQTAIQDLDENTWAAEDGIKFVTAVGETDGKISVTRRVLTAADIPALEITKITGLQDALNAKATKTELQEAVNNINTTITGTVADDIAAAKKAGDDAQSTIDSYKTANDTALAGVRATAEAATTVEEATDIADTAVSTFETGTFNPLKERVTAVETKASNNETAITNLKNTEVKANTDAIAKLAQDIGNVANVMNFRGVSTGTNPGDGITDPQNGDVIIFGESEYVYDGSSWIKFGDASDNAAAISDLQGRVTTVENSLKDGGAIDQKITAAQTTANQGVANAATAQAKADANETAIGVINGTGVGSISKAVEDAKTELKGYADTAESDAVSTAKTYTDGEIDKVEESVTNLTTTVNNNATTAANATKAVADDLAGYKTTNNAAVEAAAAKGQQGIDDAADALQAVTDLTNGQVKTNKEGIEALQADVATIETTFTKVKTVEGISSLVVGESEDVIIFDCGGASNI